MKLMFLFLFLTLALANVVTCVNYIEGYFDQKIDHFNFLSYGDKTFRQRYLYNDTWWDRGKGPVFFYAGNEGAITGFWDNLGFMFDIAPSFKALVLFAEHRYYGKSLPFGSESFQGKNLGLLSIEQTLADYAFLLRNFTARFGASNLPVIAFGGSYGGMLAAYMRFKYPNIITGAIAASAPIHQVAGYPPGRNMFFQALTKDFHDASPKCETQVRVAYAQMQEWAKLGQSGLQKISRYFGLCDELRTMEDYDHLLRWSRNAFINAGMADYPYSASFLGNLPPYPVKVMCTSLTTADTPVAGLAAAIGIYYNDTRAVKCYDIWKEYLYCADPTGCGLGDDSKAWDYQVCTEMNLEGGTDGVTDMFPPMPFNSSMRDDYCWKTWKVVPRRDWLRTLYWDLNIGSSSNIVFSNGNLDPWAPGGVLHDVSDTIVSFLVEGGAHHLDLRGHNPADPPSVIAARNFEVKHIMNWIGLTKK